MLQGTSVAGTPVAGLHKNPQQNTGCDDRWKNIDRIVQVRKNRNYIRKEVLDYAAEKWTDQANDECAQKVSDHVFLENVVTDHRTAKADDKINKPDIKVIVNHSAAP